LQEIAGCGKQSVDEKRARFLKHFVEFRGCHFPNGLENEVLFDGEKALRTNEAWLTDFAAFTIAFVQWNGESIPVCAARDLAENQVRARKIGNHQGRTPLSAGSIGPRKRDDNDFACYRFDHAVSSSGEFQSRPRTDSLSAAPLNLSSGASDASSSSSGSLMLIERIITRFTTKDTKKHEERSERG